MTTVDSGETLLVFDCVACGKGKMSCPDCVNTVAIDPMTGRPPDVATVDGEVVNVEPTQEVLDRCVYRPCCDECWTKRNENLPVKERIPTAAERHGQFHDRTGRWDRDSRW